MTARRTGAAEIARAESVDPAALDALVWAATVGPFVAHGHRFGVRATDVDLAAHLARVLEPFAADESAAPAHGYALFDYVNDEGAQRWAVFFDGERLRHEAADHRVLATLLWHVNRSVIRGIDDRVAMHAAAAARAGAAVVLPAPMESGKTTLVAGLVRAGLDYLTDEATILDPSTLEIDAYPKALSIDRGSFDVLGDFRPSGVDGRYAINQWNVPADRIRPGAVASSAIPRLIVAPRYVAGGETRLEEVSPGEAVLLLASCTFRFHEHARRNLQVLAEVVRRCPRYRLEVADLDEAVEIVLRLLDGVASSRSV